MARLPTPGRDENTWGNVLNDFLAQSHNADGSLKKAAVEATGAIADAIATQSAGAELAVAQKSDGLFTTISTTPAAVPGLSVTFTVPGRPYMVRFTGTGFLELADHQGSANIYSGGVAVGASAIGVSSVAGSNVSWFCEVRVPTPFHAPAAGVVVTYEVRMNTSNASSEVNLITGAWLGDDLVATLVAVAQ